MLCSRRSSQPARCPTRLSIHAAPPHLLLCSYRPIQRGVVRYEHPLPNSNPCDVFPPAPAPPSSLSPSPLSQFSPPSTVVGEKQTQTTTNKPRGSCCSCWGGVQRSRPSRRGDIPLCILSPWPAESPVVCFVSQQTRLHRSTCSSLFVAFRQMEAKSCCLKSASLWTAHQMLPELI